VSLVAMTLDGWAISLRDGLSRRFNDKSGPSQICDGPLETRGLNPLILKILYVDVRFIPRRDYCRIQVALEERRQYKGSILVTSLHIQY
jgi:hypothetical protein